MNSLAVKGLMTIETAVERLSRWAPVAEIEHLPLAEALARILAEDIKASMPLPPYDSAAMDGFAVRFSDIPPNKRMAIVGRVAAGHPMAAPLTLGGAVRIFTGGALPLGADTVAIQEDCTTTSGFVELPSDLQPGANRRLAGEDVSQGSIVLAAGRRLRPQDIGIAAATGCGVVPVRRRVRVAVLATGDELRTPGESLPFGCIYDSNRHAIGAALRALGADVSDLGLVPDRLDAICSIITDAATDHDLIISSGGVSAGDDDYIRPALLQIGSLDFWKLALKPGKPVAVGEVTGKPFIGLPGNPVAAMVTFWLIARPLLHHLMGANERAMPSVPVIADFRQRHRPGRREYLRARIRRDDQGRLFAEHYPSTSSAMMSSLVWSDGLVEIHENKGDIEIGDVVSFLPYDTLQS
jgi:molybdopterin molybdotransferase